MSINLRFFRLFSLAFILHLSSFIPQQPASAQLCYIVWANGQNQNLDALCRGESVLPTATSNGVTVVDNRLVFNDLDIRGSVENSGLGRVVGSFTNNSSEPLRVDFIEFQISDRRSGDVLGSVVASPRVVLQPGQTARINQPFDNDLIGRRPYARVSVGVTDWL